jgi:hypothetical protein
MFAMPLDVTGVARANVLPPSLPSNALLTPIWMQSVAVNAGGTISHFSNAQYVEFN